MGSNSRQVWVFALSTVEGALLLGRTGGDLPYFQIRESRAFAASRWRMRSRYVFTFTVRCCNRDRGGITNLRWGWGILLRKRQASKWLFHIEVLNLVYSHR